MTNLLHFPDTTFVNKLVPKTAFWKRGEKPTELKNFLTDEFESIVWMYKLASSTLNVADGERVHEVDVFWCKMKQDHYSLKPLCGMDDLIPRHTMFVVEYGESIDIIMQYKEQVDVRGEKKWKYGTTEMQRGVDLSTVSIDIKGQTMDVVYASLLSQISGLNAHDETEYKEQVELRKKIASIEKQIATLQSNIQKEKQFNKQIEMNGEARALKKELAALKSSLK